VTASDRVIPSPSSSSSSDASRDEYTVHEQIPVLPMGLWKTTISFTVVFEDRDDGVWSKVLAPLGFVSEALYEVRRRTGDEERLGLGEEEEEEDGVVDAEGRRVEAEWVLRETVTSSCYLVFRPFVDASLVPTRREMAERLMAKVVADSRGIDG